MTEDDEIDLRSDTVTRPTEAMREAARDATVGDDVYGEDPTVAELERRAAEAVGKAAALYVPSGTMGNQIAIRTHTDRGQELLLDREAHVYRWELGGPAQLSGVQPRPIDAGDRSVPTAGQVHDAVVEESLHRPGTGLLALENTHNFRGGAAVPREDLAAAAEAARDHDVPVHLDGARLFNAAVALDTPAPELCAPVDTVNVCLSKGLGAPVGSVLAGPEAFVERARRVRKLLGGGMRQAGIVAAPALRALESVDRLAVDHENAARLAAGLHDLSGLRAPEPDTNIVVVDTEGAGLTAEAFVETCDSVGVLGGAFDEHTVRFCTHRDVTTAGIDAAVERIAGAL